MLPTVPNTPSRMYGDTRTFTSDTFAMQDYLDKNGRSVIPGDDVLTAQGPGFVMNRVRPGLVRVTFGTCSRHYLTREMEVV